MNTRSFRGFCEFCPLCRFLDKLNSDAFQFQQFLRNQTSINSQLHTDVLHSRRSGMRCISPIAIVYICVCMCVRVSVYMPCWTTRKRFEIASPFCRRCISLYLLMKFNRVQLGSSSTFSSKTMIYRENVGLLLASNIASGIMLAFDWHIYI